MANYRKMSNDLGEQLYNPSHMSEERMDGGTINSSISRSSVSSASTDVMADDDIQTAMSIDTITPVMVPVPERKRQRWFLLEPAVFSVFLAMYLSGTVYQNQLLYQTCIYVYKYNDSECQPLLGVERESPEVQDIEARIQPYVSKILMARSILESIIPAVVSLFIGPWSDKFGRRPIILVTFTGYLSGSIITAILVFISTHVKISPWLFLLSSVPSVLSGGTCALITGIYCYISDMAKAKARALRMVLNEASLLAGMMIGNVISGYLYAATNSQTVFTISSILILLSLIYVYFCVVESLKPEQIHSGSRIREFFRYDLIKDLVLTCLKQRANYDSTIIWLTMAALTLALFIMEGDSNVTYLFVRRRFEWTLKDYTLFNAIRIIVQIIGSLVGMFVLRRLLGFSIISMCLISLASCVLESTVRATAIYWWQLYLGLGLGMMRGIMGPMCRAILSHIAPSDEVGKIFALTTSLESLTPLIAAPLYTIVYNATLSYYPGLFNFISASLFSLCFTLIAVIFGIHKSLGESVIYQAIGS